MSNDADRPPISRPLKVEEIRDGAGGEIDATQSEMADIAGMLDLVGLAGFAFTYRLHRGGAGRLRLTGRLKAAVTQTCVVSLDPVETSIDVPVEVEFWPVSMIEELEQAADEPSGSGLRDWLEPIAGGKIDLGPAIYETLLRRSTFTRNGRSKLRLVARCLRWRRARWDWPICGPCRAQAALKGPPGAKSGCHWRAFKSNRVSFPGVAAVLPPHE